MALSSDSRRGLSTFLRTRATSMWQLLAPRVAVSAAAVTAAYLLGTLAAWYETALLLGAPPAGAMLAGMLCGSVHLIFATTVTAAAAAIARSTLGTVGIAVAALLALPVLGMVSPVHNWLPSTLVNAPVDLLGTSQLTDFVPALAVSAATGALLLAIAVTRLRAREI